MNPKAHEVTATYRDLVLAALPGRIERIVLFGSRARGDHTEHSDWDMAVYLDRPPDFEDRRRLSSAGFQTLCRTGELIQSIALSRDEWGSDDGFGRRVREQGIVIYG